MLGPPSRRLLLALVLLVVAVSANADHIVRPLLLRERSMVMAHDAGTTYLEGKSVVNHWAKTQPSGGFEKLLDCGARALDVRCKAHGREVIMHHGEVPVRTTLRQGILDVQRWTSNNPGELVYMYISHGEDDIADDVEAILADTGVSKLSCKETLWITYEEALAKGPVIATIGCMEENYDPGIVCEDANGPCWWLKHTEERIGKLVGYLNSTIHFADRQPTLWMLQAHWQYDSISIALGIIEGSSILKDNEKSKMNSAVAKFLKAIPSVVQINIVELDNVCAYGPDIHEYFLERNLALVAVAAL